MNRSLPSRRIVVLRTLILLVVAGSISWLVFRRPDRPSRIGRVGPYDPFETRWESKAGVIRLRDVREPVMGTRFGLEIAAPDYRTAKKADIAAWRRIADLEGKMSTWGPGTVRSRVNREAADHPVKVDPDTFAVLRKAREVWSETGGAFDPTVGPLIDLWHPKHRSTLPAPPTVAEITAARALVGMDKVTLDPIRRTVRFSRPGMALDLGGIAKGYSADAAAKAALDAGALACRVNAGGDLTCRGVPAYSPRGFEVEIRNPSGGEDSSLPDSTFYLKDRAVATSGNYERFTRIGSKHYSHIVDPRTGRPVPNTVAQVTVLAKTGTLADAMATALTVLGPGGGRKLAETMAGVQAMFLVHGPHGWKRLATPGFPEPAR